MKVEKVITYKIDFTEIEMKEFQNVITEKINNGTATEIEKEMYSEIQKNI